MGKKSFIFAAVIVSFLLIGVVAVYAYDSGRKDEIAKGVSIGGVDVGGLTAAKARLRLRHRIVAPLKQSVTARYRGRRFTLTAEQARVSVDIDRSVQAAVDRSRAGGVLSRTVRGLTGGKVNARLDVNIAYDRGAVSRLVARVGRQLARPAVDAKVDISGSGVAAKRSHRGLAVDTRGLSRALKRQVTSRTARHEVPVRVTKVKPKVSTHELASKYPSVIVINRSAFTLHLFTHLKDAKDYRIAVGKAGLETPAGLYNIQDKQVNPSWHVPNSAWAGSLAGTVVPPGPSDPIKSRWMGIYNGAGIHGTDDIGSLGSAASHGCVRMAIPDVQDLFDRVDIGTPVYVA